MAAKETQQEQEKLSTGQMKVNEQLEITQKLLESIAKGYNKIDAVVKPVMFKGNQMVASAQAELKTRR